MDFWIAVVSGGAAVLGATVGGLVAALPAWGAEKRAAETARRGELRVVLLGVLKAIHDSANEYRRDVMTAEAREAGNRFIHLHSELGTLVRPNEGAVPTYLSAVMACVVRGHAEARSFIVDASIMLPSWFRGETSLAEIQAATRALPEVDELHALD